MKYPMLYKKTSTGAIQFWEICVDDDMATSIIVTKYGQLGTDSPQETRDRISEGKNSGRKNATRHFEQAIKEAKAKWEKQKKKGYVETIKAAEAGELDQLIKGGIVPMLAHKFSEHGHKIKYPCYIQPKLDGIRCIAIVKNGSCTLWSRTRKPIMSCPHIIRELEIAFEGRDLILDGELYSEAMKANFEKIVSLVRQEEPGTGYESIQYHVYDLVDSVMSFEQRLLVLDHIFDDYEFHTLEQVSTGIVSETEVMDRFYKYCEQGYEGAMLRNSDGRYVNKRSCNLQKVKEFQDEEFDIVDIEEGRGRLAGHVGAFICVNGLGKEFKAKAKGETAKLAEYFKNHSLWKGKKLTVQYQGLTGAEGVPRFPVGIAIRDYE